MIAGRILFALLAVLHLAMLLFFAVGMGMGGYRSSVSSGPDPAVAVNACAVLLLAILIGSALAGFRLILHAAAVAVVVSLFAILLNDIEIHIPFLPSVGVACLPISALWLWFYARVAWFR